MPAKPLQPGDRTPWRRYSRSEPVAVADAFKRACELHGANIDHHQAAAKWLYWRLPAEMRDRAVLAAQGELSEAETEALEVQMEQFRMGWRSAIAALSSDRQPKTGTKNVLDPRR